MIDVDSLRPVSYNYTVVFYEASGISASDTVMVDVSVAPTPTTTSTTEPTTSGPTTTDGFDLSQFLSDNMLLIGLGGGALVLIIVIVVLKRR